jgi:hypothetical protein
VILIIECSPVAQAEFEQYRRERLESDRQARAALDAARDELARQKVETAKAQNAADQERGTVFCSTPAFQLINHSCFVAVVGCAERFKLLEEKTRSEQAEIERLRLKTAEVPSSSYPSAPSTLFGRQ